MRLRAPFGRPLGLPLCPGLKGTRFLKLFLCIIRDGLSLGFAHLQPLCSLYVLANVHNDFAALFNTISFRRLMTRLATMIADR